MKLYHFWRSSASYRVRIALNLKGLDADLVPVDILAGEHRGAAFTALNPQGFLPVLVHEDVTLGQSFAIRDRLEAQAAETAIRPADSVRPARAMQIGAASWRTFSPPYTLIGAAASATGRTEADARKGRSRYCRG
ncbi:glutathione S-transferase N-terminal domain-containing protein [Jiella sp. M17.18]|uniref:glutathione S-transferase N-terminal domain-containing protein n=1 Tax=Jiella sp. M17.18 TaxID=3234247 RepID=UPI0034DE42A1